MTDLETTVAILAIAFVVAIIAAARAESAHSEIQLVKNRCEFLEKRLDCFASALSSIGENHSKAISDLGECVRMIGRRA